MELLPSVDLRRGRVVRLLGGDDACTTDYGGDPLAVLARARQTGVARLHVVDLDAAFGEPAQHELLARLAAERERPALQLGGGIRDPAAVEWALGVGFDRVVLGSLVVRDPAAFAALTRRFPGRLVPALDVAAGAVRIAGWRDISPLAPLAAARALSGLPCPALLVTDVERDGGLSGPNLELTVELARASGLPGLVSGGIARLADLRAAAARPEIAGAVVGRALYEGAFTLAEGLVACASPSALTHRVIPCLDVAAGRVVKGVRFAQLQDQGDPATAAARYAAQGADELVFLDVTAAPEQRGTDLSWVRAVAEQVFVPLTVGGGVRQLVDAQALLGAGADKVGVNSAAVTNPALLTAIAERYGSQCAVLAIDARRRPGGGWEVVTHGGRTPTRREAVAWAREGVAAGAGEILLTSIDADGTRGGYDLSLLAAVAGAVPVPVIASGGAGEPSHLVAALRAGAAAVLAASIFHQGHYSVGEVKAALAAAGLPVRPVWPVVSEEAA